MKLSRRSFVMLPALLPLRSLAAGGLSREFHFHYDHVLGTSLDLAVWLPESIADESIPQRALGAALAEIHRLSAILNTREVNSEIRRFERGEVAAPSRELLEIFELYRVWERRSGGLLSIRPLGSNTPLNVDALGKAYIIDRAAAAARSAAPSSEGLLLNVGGDIVVWGRPCELGIANPSSPQDNADPLTRVILREGAVATSGSYARGSHLINARTGNPIPTASAATVVARNAVTANALATTLCIANAEEGLQLVENTAEAEALRIAPDGVIVRSGGFARMEQFPAGRLQKVQLPVATNWPTDYQVTIGVTLTNPDPRLDRPYLAAWVEDPAGKLVRAIVLWGSKSKYYSDMTSFWLITGGSESLLYKVTRATRAPGSYKIVWNGLDNDGKPVPKGNYRIVIETNRYHGTYAKQSGMIACNNEPANITLSGSTNFEAITIQYGPKPPAA